MNTSEQLDKLSEALSLAQSEFKPVIKNQVNPHFRNKFADLATIFEATREALSKNGIAVCQSPEFRDGRVCVSTRLLHKSGQWIESELSLKPKVDDPQSVGSAITYAKRYSLSAVLAISADDDDDGEAASKASQPNVPQVKLYKGLHEEKVELIKLFDKHGVTDQDLKSRIHSKCIGKPYGELEKIVIELVG